MSDAPRWSYSVFSETAVCEGFKPYLSYGIKADRLLPSGPEFVCAVHDMSPDLAFLHFLINRFNALQLDPCQLTEVITDFLSF